MNSYIGHPSQLSGVEEYRLIGGKGDGMRLLQVRNGLGLEFTVSADRAADITRLSYEGVNYSYISPSGYVAPAYYDQQEFGFLKSFTCGFLTTCGLSNIGVPTEDESGKTGLHGTISNIPADHIYYTEDDDKIVLHAAISDGEIFKQKLVLHRELVCSKKENKLQINDTVTNEGSRTEPLSILYHMNLGYPLLDENAKLETTAVKVEARDARAQEGIDTWDTFLTPQPNFEEQCYYHTFEGLWASAKLTNSKIGKGLEIKCDTSTLDTMVEWKMMGERDYVLGIEPTNNRLLGRGELKKQNLLKYIEPGEAVCFRIEANFYRV